MALVFSIASAAVAVADPYPIAAPTVQVLEAAEGATNPCAPSMTWFLTLQGTADPNGAATSVSFQYGTTTDYGQSTPAQQVPAGTDAVIVTAQIPDTQTIHYRIVATNASGTVDSTDESQVHRIAFSCPGVTGAMGSPPAVQVQGVTRPAVAGSCVFSAAVNGTVIPGPAPAAVSVQYGQSTSYGETTTPQSLAAGTQPIAVSAPIFSSSRTIHYRLLVTSSDGVAASPDQTYTFPQSCPRSRTKPDAHFTLRVTVTGAAQAVRVILSCPTAAKACAGRITLTVTDANRSRKIGARSYTVIGGARRVLIVSLDQTGKKLLARHSLPVRVSIIGHDRYGHTHTTTKRLTLPASR